MEINKYKYIQINTNIRKLKNDINTNTSKNKICFLYKVRDRLNGGGTDLSTTISNKANDSDVVHKSGNEVINGNKWFSGSSLYFNYANVDNVKIFADGEGGNIRLTDSDNNYHYEFDTVAKNYLRLYCGNSNEELTGCFCFLPNGDFLPAQGSVQNLGSLTYKWKNVNTTLINGVNPGALSLPSTSDRVSIVGHLTFDGVVNEVEILKNGYISIVINGGASGEFISCYCPSTATGVTAVPDSASEMSVCFPVVANTIVRIRIKCENVGASNFFIVYCQGNV